jgi:hypothetical protein
MDETVASIKKIMIDVSTGIARIQDSNDEYSRLWNEIAAICRDQKLKNPNPYSDLWEFYAYWSKKLPKYVDRRTYISKMYKDFRLENQEKSIESGVDFYINLDRLNALKATQCIDHDLSKLIKLCEEINFCYANNCFLAVIVLLRSILDHVPPIFQFDTFSEVCGGYGKKTFKEITSRLNESSRKIADSYLHDPIRKRETLPNKTQVNFSQELDYLLAEIISLIK